MTNWNDLRKELKHMVFSVGVENVAHAIPADRATVYRLLNGKTNQPTLAIKASVQRIVNDYNPEDGYDHIQRSHPSDS